MLAMSVAGIPVSMGLTFSLLLRLEQVFWTGIGFVAYAGVLWQRRREAPPPQAP
jgi:predicted nucleotidyltransferase